MCTYFIIIIIKFSPSVLESAGIHVLTRYIRDFSLFNVCSVIKNCPPARFASAANDVCRHFDIFRNVSLDHIYCKQATSLLDITSTQ
jgi:hypothetical protein